VYELKKLFLATLEIASDNDVVAKVADIHWNYLNELMRRGFTRDEAMQLMLRTPLIGGSPPK
jgi:hypothetical protein